MDLSSTAFWAGLGSIIIANILLSGDNAVVIALAARSLPAHQQKKAILFGSGAAIVLRILLTLVAAAMLRLPFLKIIGGLLLLYIGVDLLGGDDEGEGELGKENGNLGSAVRTILVADLVMSLDNVLAVAAAAKGDTTLLVLGLAISIPLIVFGSTLLRGIMQRFPIIITLGAALLGFLAGEMVMTDPAVTERWADLPHIWANLAGVAGALLVVALGRWRHSRQAPVATDT